jgi:hypothetical protein
VRVLRRAVELGVNLIDTADAYAGPAGGRRGARVEAIPLPDTGSVRGDLREHVRRVCEFCTCHSGRVFAQLLAACVTDPGASRFFREFFLAGRRKTVAELGQRAVDRGATDRNVDVETAIDTLFGPLVFRLMSGHAPP